VWFRSDASDGFVVHSFAGDSFLECREHVRRCLQIPRSNDRFAPRPRPERTAPTPHDRALRIWSEALNPIGRAVESYLARRGIGLGSYAPGAALRFHPRCPWGRDGTRTPAMVALLRDIFVAARWREAEREVFCVQPVVPCNDLNDIVKGAHA
jgi:hypothetical protein